MQPEIHWISAVASTRRTSWRSPKHEFVGGLLSAVAVASPPIKLLSESGSHNPGFRGARSRHFGQEVGGPAVDVVFLDDTAHAAYSRLSLLCIHHDGVMDRRIRPAPEPTARRGAWKSACAELGLCLGMDRP